MAKEASLRGLSTRRYRERNTCLQGGTRMRVFLAAALALVVAPAFAAPKIAGLAAKQSAPQEVQVTVTIERPPPVDMLCDTSVSLGDGTTKAVNFGMGDKHQKTLQHKYAKSGTYK